MKRNALLAIGLIGCLFLGTFSFAQNATKASIFDRYDQLLAKLQHGNAQIFSPENYEKALKLYKKATEEFEKDNPDMNKIKENLRKCASYASDALNNIQTAQSLFKETITARLAALDAGAPQFAAEEWEKAEEKFKDAGEELEDNDKDDAIEESSKAAELYLQARILALKNSILEEARADRETAKNLGAPKLCPETFQALDQSIKDTELLIEESPDSLMTIRRKGEEAAYYGRHAILLSKIIKKMMSSDGGAEAAILKFEDLLSSIAEPFNYHPFFDQGYSQPVETILAYIANLKNEQKRLMRENDSLKNELMTLKEKEMGISRELQKKKELEEKIAHIKSLFGPNEAEVRVQGDNLLIRLSGLKFQPGKAIIQPEYFSLLTKVQRALREFPKSYVVVQGHTDATGNAYKNKLLSEKRALAVKEYLNANIDLDPNQIQVIGMGDQMPIASNKTAEGRAKNRRIDILIALPK